MSHCTASASPPSTWRATLVTRATRARRSDSPRGSACPSRIQRDSEAAFTSVMAMISDLGTCR
ncbi:Uncharacterised protein [Bordetella pertussis]|nr:Uncharacterised protein [Bordetella pertussis]